MVVNYSKWDALELSDDSDIEVHPNVDKRSFIRAKQNQIHQQRYDRRHQIETLKYERIVNDGLLERIDALLAALRSHEAEARNSGPEQYMMQALMLSHGDPSKDQPPQPPEGVYTKSEQPRYSQMMASLVDQVKSDAGAQPEDWYRSYTNGIEAHRTKVQNLQTELQAKLAELEKEEGKKITSDSIHTGFDRSSVSKAPEKPQPPAPKPKAEAVEVLNPGSLSKKKLLRSDSAQSSGADADVDEPPAAAAADTHDDDVEASALGKEFAKIAPGDYPACLAFIAQHPSVVAERETDGLLIEGFNAQMDGRAAYARQCVHQALLLQYCRSLGRDGVGLFFKRITTPAHQAQKVFLDDVASTYARIRTRTAELTTERAAAPPTEQIQLHAVDPGTQIHINIPAAHSADEVESAARRTFEAFPPGLQRALESGELEEVNKVLGKMSVEEAEEVVSRLGEGGMLSLEEGVIDGTTEEGRERLRVLEEGAGAGAGGEGGAGGVGQVEGVQDGVEAGAQERVQEGVQAGGKKDEVHEGVGEMEAADLD